ncbi:MAG TPA: Lrp/AsnC family transcriptional regulator [Casimicrobiaceae bacterium]|nr:Lrp/AsnC family transcriptional regulator [Casimicrobiaceae bacterium]
MRECRLLNEFQRDFPLVPMPYAVLASALGRTESGVLTSLRRLIDVGLVSRVGAIFRPGSVGASTLAAMAVPQSRLASVARSVSAHAGVNHNYEREHRFNLWFVASAEDRRALDALLMRIGRDTVMPVIAMPLVTEYHIDLGFDLDSGGRDAAVASPCSTTSQPSPFAKAVSPAARGASPALDATQRRIVAALQEGLALTSRPYAQLAERAGLPREEGEARVLSQLRTWCAAGVVKRIGVIVRHRPLGFVANAMAVWDVPDADTDAAGRALAREAGVTLCYRRARALPAWPYSLYCMIHGRERADVDARLDTIVAHARLARYPHARLFSRTEFKQRGARHFETAVADG